MERTVPEAIRLKQEAAIRAQAAKLAAALGPIQKSLHGSLHLIVPGQPNLEYSAGAGHVQVDDGELRQLAPVAENIVLLDLARTASPMPGCNRSLRCRTFPALRFKKPIPAMRCCNGWEISPLSKCSISTVLTPRTKDSDTSHR